jgi:hypothetical protein
MTVLKVETYITTSITASLIERVVILVIMYVATLNCYYQESHNVFDITWTENLQYQSKSNDIEI